MENLVLGRWLLASRKLFLAERWGIKESKLGSKRRVVFNLSRGYSVDYFTFSLRKVSGVDLFYRSIVTVHGFLTFWNTYEEIFEVQLVIYAKRLFLFEESRKQKNHRFDWIVRISTSKQARTNFFFYIPQAIQRVSLFTFPESLPVKSFGGPKGSVVIINQTSYNV